MDKLINLCAGGEQTAGLVKCITMSVTYADFEAEATSDYIDFADAIPGCSFVLGWVGVVSEGFSGGAASEATFKVGTSDTADAYSAAAPSVFEAGTVGSVCKTTGVALVTEDTTPRLTLTVTDDNCSSLETGAAEVTLYYIEL